MSVEVAITDVVRSIIHGWLWDLRKCDWSDEANDVGGLTAAVPARHEDADRMSQMLAIDTAWRIAEVRVRGQPIHAYVVEALATQRQEGELVWEIDGSGMVRLWEGVPVLSEVIESNAAPVDERIFGPGSKSPFADLINWHSHKNLKRVGDNSMPGWDSLLWKPDAPRNGTYAVKEQDLIDDGVAEEEAEERDGEYPDQDAYWIGPPAMSTDEDDMPFMAPPGTWWVRERFTLSEASDFILLITADEFYALFIDGVEMGATTGDVYKWRSWDAYEFGLPAGKHTIAIRVEEILRPFASSLAHRAPEVHSDNAGCRRDANYSWSSTAVLYSMWLIDNVDEPPERLDDKTPWMHSGSTSPRVADIGQYTGWTPGEILLTLLDEAEQEALCAGDTTMPPLTLLETDFDIFVDSAGKKWQLRVDHAFSTMRSGGMEVIRKLAELGAETKIDPSSRTIQAYNIRGDDRTTGVDQVVIDRWRDMMSENFELTSGPVNSIRVRYRFGVAIVDEPSSIASFGRVWQPLQLGDALSAAQARQGGNRALQDVAHARESEPIALPDRAGGPQPYQDFFPGDEIWTRDEQGQRKRQRAWTIGGSLRDDGAIEWEVEADEPLTLAQETRKARIRHGLQLGHDVQAHSGARMTVEVDHGLKLGHDVSTHVHPAAIDATIDHGIKLGHAVDAAIVLPNDVTINHGIKLGHDVTVESIGPLGIFIDHGIKLGHSVEANVNDPPDATVSVA